MLDNVRLGCMMSDNVGLDYMMLNVLDLVT